ncbi:MULTISPECIES: cyclic nucleotide-binding domain-containing protein [Desulfococcus]|jgi:CRP-like cAMP-binding protein|uniref:Putative transcriptional regulator, Crp/Fnr family n=1 Tax=Desulfococcus multivorans DSM 2059 TaxID=1121405 RepID=S7V3B0_DESML|nr:cyclic nucleotide-binding domain-containing protein [Desulfococcus multivorans]AOY58950.1 cyclic nucleotide-binding protein [Desulfococcus multivorans]AQV01218.1 hypothetical protein B2D07_10865 [Desulfococcus multivorans]EPR39143.1 putative transcriptional regulator, Crp/Fnr family [Desulfococcus multivorans DSM 2059]MDX9818675.1 cyclic nucleotide-binding domain-containing protein [Desulfococcus multivorans]SJZ53913.1 cAMP-binding domain of CRP or a regulatory subunit of cAMP-dependent pro
MGKVALAGSLGFLSLGDILQLVGSGGGSGLLRIFSPYAHEPGCIYFKKGNIIDAHAPGARGLEAVYALFGWLEGDFEFQERPVSTKRIITTNRMEIILEGLRLFDDGRIKTLGPPPLEKNVPDPAAPPFIRRHFIDYTYVVDEELYAAGELVTQEKHHGNWIWVVLEGTLDIIRSTPRGRLTVSRVGPGAFIGSVTAFLFQENTRKATVTATTDVQLGILDIQRMSKEFAMLSPAFRGYILSLDRRLSQVTGACVNYYNRIDTLPKVIRDKALMPPRTLKEGRLLRIERGHAAMTRKTEHGTLLIANLGEGDYLGTVPFLDIGHEPHQVSVFVSGDVKTTDIDAGSLESEYEDLPLTFKNLIENIAVNIAATTNVAGNLLKQNRVGRGPYPPGIGPLKSKVE